MLAILIAARLLLGAAQGGLFPVATGAIKNWFPVRNWGFAQGFLITGAWLGSAITPPIVSALELHFGWRQALAAVCIPSVLLLAWWQYDAAIGPRSIRPWEPRSSRTWPRIPERWTSA